MNNHRLENSNIFDQNNSLQIHPHDSARPKRVFFWTKISRPFFFQKYPQFKKRENRPASEASRVCARKTSGNRPASEASRGWARKTIRGQGRKALAHDASNKFVHVAMKRDAFCLIASQNNRETYQCMHLLNFICCKVVLLTP